MLSRVLSTISTSSVARRDHTAARAVCTQMDAISITSASSSSASYTTAISAALDEDSTSTTYCPEYDISFIGSWAHRRSNLRRHLRLKHSAGRISCNECGLAFSRANNFALHQRRAHGKSLSNVDESKRWQRGLNSRNNSSSSRASLTEEALEEPHETPHVDNSIQLVSAFTATASSASRPTASPRVLEEQSRNLCNTQPSFSLRTCHKLMLLWLLSLVTSLIPALWESIVYHDIQGGFSIAQ